VHSRQNSRILACDQDVFAFLCPLGHAASHVAATPSIDRHLYLHRFHPIVPLLLMAGIGSYLLAEQFATYIAISNLQSGLQHLEAANEALAAQLRTLELSGKLNKQIAGELTTASGENFPQRTVTVWRDENGLILSTGGVLLELVPPKYLMLLREISAVSLLLIKTACICARSSAPPTAFYHRKDRRNLGARQWTADVDPVFSPQSRSALRVFR
jgi:hypothetical protein